MMGKVAGLKLASPRLQPHDNKWRCWIVVFAINSSAEPLAKMPSIVAAGFTVKNQIPLNPPFAKGGLLKLPFNKGGWGEFGGIRHYHYYGKNFRDWL
jgi:hypothetical protein